MQNQVVVIETLEQLYDEAAGIFFDNAPIRTYKISSAVNIQLIVKGKYWDGHVDYKLAKFVLKLQDEIFNIYNTATDENVDLRSQKSMVESLAIGVEVKEGSSFINIELGEKIQELINRMESKHVFWLGTVGFIVLGSYLTLGQVLDYNRDIAKFSKDEQEKKEVLSLTKEAIYNLRATQSSMDYLIRNMGKDDKLVIPKEDRTLTKKEAKSLLPPPVDRSPVERSLWVDDLFEVTILNLGKQTIRLKKGDVQFDAASISLRDKDKGRLLAVVKKSIEENKVKKMNLRLTIIFKDGEVDTCSITGIGEKRKEANTLADALKKVGK